MNEKRRSFTYIFILTWIGLLPLTEISHADHDPGRILIYPTVMPAHRVRLHGRVIEDKGHAKASRKRHKIVNLWNSVRTLESDEIEDFRLRLTVNGHRFEATTDDDGVFTVDADHITPPLPVGQLSVETEVLDDQGHPTPPTTDQIFVMPEAPILLVSDFDDTVVHSNITSRRTMLKTALLKNAAQLDPVKGAAAAYAEALRGGVHGVIYLSGSPQNFITRIRQFLTMNGFPPGAIILKNFGVGRGADPLLDQMAYKGGRLAELAQVFPKARFILVGDSGERDPEIYAAFAEAHPGRVIKTIIRRASGGSADKQRNPAALWLDEFTPAALTLP